MNKNEENNLFISEDDIKTLKEQANTMYKEKRYVNYTFENVIVPGTAKILHERAKCFQSIQDDVRAIQDFTRVLKLMPTNVNAIVRRAFSYKNLGQHETAAREWRRADKYKDQLNVEGYLKNYSMLSTYISSERFIELQPPGNEENDIVKPSKISKQALGTESEDKHEEEKKEKEEKEQQQQEEQENDNRPTDTNKTEENITIIEE